MTAAPTPPNPTPPPKRIDRPPADNPLRSLLVLIFRLLLLGVGGKLRFVGNQIHQRNFVPEEQAIAVAEIVQVITLRIMGQADGGHSHIQHDPGPDTSRPQANVERLPITFIDR